MRDALAEGLPVTAAPGPSAAITALTLSGLPPDLFLFAGFLPPRQAARKKALAAWRDLAATLVFYEGPSRLAAALADMAEILGDRDAAVGTRAHQIARGDPPRPAVGARRALSRGRRAAGRDRHRRRPADAETAPLSDAELDRRLADALGRLSLRDAAALVAEETGLPRRELYSRALALQKPGA